MDTKQPVLPVETKVRLEKLRRRWKEIFSVDVEGDENMIKIVEFVSKVGEWEFKKGYLTGFIVTALVIILTLLAGRLIP